ncbi:MAG: septum site-determining protein MinC, partial [Paraclostridium sp.]
MSLNSLPNEELVEFKGNKKGIVVNIKRKASFDDIRQSMVEKIESSIGFFNGAKICEIDCKYLSDIQIMQLKEDITSKFDIEFIEESKQLKSYEDYRTKYISNMRSGDNIEFEGDVVVMNDMKPGCQVITTGNVVVMGNVSTGAKVIANGNVVVMGKVEGFIYAGAKGNTSAYIVSNYFNPK